MCAFRPVPQQRKRLASCASLEFEEEPRTKQPVSLQLQSIELIQWQQEQLMKNVCQQHEKQLQELDLEYHKKRAILVEFHEKREQGIREQHQLVLQQVREKTFQPPEKGSQIRWFYSFTIPQILKDHEIQEKNKRHLASRGTIPSPSALFQQKK